MNVEIREGYPKWKELFDSADEARKKYGVKVLAYGHPKDDEKSDPVKVKAEVKEEVSKNEFISEDYGSFDRPTLLAKLNALINNYDVEIIKIVEDKKEQVQAFFNIMGAKVNEIKVEGDKATITTAVPLPEPFTKPLGEDISRLTGIKTIKFTKTRDLQASDVKAKE